MGNRLNGKDLLEITLKAGVSWPEGSYVALCISGRIKQETGGG